jgi:hypothetical protein
MVITSLVLTGVLQVEECCLVRPILLAYSDRWSFGGKLDNSILTGSQPDLVSTPVSMSGMILQCRWCPCGLDPRCNYQEIKLSHSKSGALT